MAEKILAVCGATASGKTGFSIDAAQELGGEVVSADCMLVYRGLDIGTAKPTSSEKRGVPHHMIDIVSPRESYSVSDYERGALSSIEQILSRGKLPVICGGTGFYIQSLLFSRSNGGIGADERVRKKYNDYAEQNGKEALYALLCERDPHSAEKIHCNDQKRVVRALEIFELTGRRKSEQCDGFVPRRPYLAVAFDYPREELYSRINFRVDEMIRAGLVDEVRALYENGIDETCQSMQGIGYKEVLQYLKNEISHSTMCDVIKQNTRNYAKRQLTFFRKLPGIVWLDPKAKNNLELVREMLCRI